MKKTTTLLFPCCRGGENSYQSFGEKETDKTEGGRCYLFDPECDAHDRRWINIVLLLCLLPVFSFPWVPGWLPCQFPSTTSACGSRSCVSWRSCSHAVVQSFRQGLSLSLETAYHLFFFFLISCLEHAPSASHLFQDMQLASVSLLFHLQFHSCMCPTHCCFVQWQHLD